MRPTDFSVNQECRKTSTDFCNVFLPISTPTSTSYSPENFYYVPTSTSSKFIHRSSYELSSTMGNAVEAKPSLDLYPTFEVLEGKEVVTLTTSNVCPPHNTLTVSQEANSKKCISSEANSKKCISSSVRENGHGERFSFPSERDVRTPPLAFRTLCNFEMAGQSTDDKKWSSEFVGSHTCLYKPEDFIPLSKKVDVNLDKIGRLQRNHIDGSSLTMAVRELFPGDSPVLPEKRGMVSENLLKYGGGVDNFDYKLNADSNNVNYKSDVEGSSDPDDDYEQELLDLELQDEDDDDKETKAGGNKTSGYDNSKLPPIGVFWDIENCQVRLAFMTLLFGSVLNFLLTRT